MLSKVVELQDTAMAFSLERDLLGLPLFDFAAAFPSISQEYLLHMLKLLGLPAAVHTLPLPFTLPTRGSHS